MLSQETLMVFVRLHTFKIDIKCTKICGLLVAYWQECWKVPGSSLPQAAKVYFPSRVPHKSKYFLVCSDSLILA